jgi:hypothetical protein
MNEWSCTSTPPISLQVVDRENITFLRMLGFGIVLHLMRLHKCVLFTNSRPTNAIYNSSGSEWLGSEVVFKTRSPWRTAVGIFSATERAFCLQSATVTASVVSTSTNTCSVDAPYVVVKADHYRHSEHSTQLVQCDGREAYVSAIKTKIHLSYTECVY